MSKFLFLCLFGMSLLFGDIDFDALAAKKPAQSSITIDMSDAVKAGNKQWKEKVKENKAEYTAYRKQQRELDKKYTAGGSISLCVPPVPYKCCKKTECRAKSVSGRYENVTVELMKDSVGDCYTLNLYGGRRYGGGTTCSGANGSWSMNVGSLSGTANGLSNAIAWMLQRM